MKLVWILIIVLVTQVEARIYDCFTFYNEFDILEVRLHELYDQVDYFILVESDTTFQGNRKPLLFDENKTRYHRFLDKIIHVIVTDMPMTHNPWDRERHQRNAIIRGLEKATDEDIILISDADEIPSRECVERIKSAYLAEHANPVALELAFRIFWLNVEPEAPMPQKIANPVVCRCKQLREIGAEEMRAYRGDYEVWKESGWHFTNAGGEIPVDFFITKIQSFSHAECNTGTFDRDGIQNMINSYGHRVSDDALFPYYVRENWELFKVKRYIRSH